MFDRSVEPDGSIDKYKKTGGKRVLRRVGLDFRV